MVETNLISNSLQSADDDVPYISRQRDSGTDIQSTETSVSKLVYKFVKMAEIYEYLRTA